MSVIFTLCCSCCIKVPLIITSGLTMWMSNQFVSYMISISGLTEMYTCVIFLLAPLSFSTGQITLRELPFCVCCQFKCCASLPVSQLSSSISFLCCTGAEHYVNLVIGTGPSPLYGFLLSRSTWLVKEDGMKINEVQLIQEGGTSPTLPLRR